MRLFKASSAFEDLLIVFLLVFVCECSFMSSDENWRCEVRGVIDYDKKLGGYRDIVKFVIKSIAARARAHDESDWYEYLVVWQCLYFQIYKRF